MGKRVLLACEESQVVTKEFRRLGAIAFSCDLQECSGGHPEWHIKEDVTTVLTEDWSLVVAFPPCTDLASSGARWFKDKRANGRQQRSVEFFMQFTELQMPWAIENPIGIMSTIFRKPDQIIQPYQFGHGETKATCLWLHKLPVLSPTNLVDGREQRVWKMPPSLERSKLRSKTFLGVAKAMAEQWWHQIHPKGD